MQQKIHMKTTHKRFIRLTPFRNHSSLRKFFIQKCPEILPECNCSLAVRISLYK